MKLKLRDFRTSLSVMLKFHTSNGEQLANDTKPASIELLGIGCTDDIENVLSSLIQQGVKRDDIFVRRIVPLFRGTNRAIFTVTDMAVQTLLKRRRIRVGMVNCRIRLLEEKNEMLPLSRIRPYGSKLPEDGLKQVIHDMWLGGLSCKRL